MRFTYQAYCDVLDAIGDHIRNPRPYGSRSQVDEAIARHREPHRAVRWEIRPDVPARMQQAPANQFGATGMVP